MWKNTIVEDYFAPQAGVLGKTCLATLLKLMARFPSRENGSPFMGATNGSHCFSLFLIISDSSLPLSQKLMEIIGKVTSFTVVSGSLLSPLRSSVLSLFFACYDADILFSFSSWMCRG